MYSTVGTFLNDSCSHIYTIVDGVGVCWVSYKNTLLVELTRTYLYTYYSLNLYFCLKSKIFQKNQKFIFAEIFAKIENANECSNSK